MIQLFGHEGAVNALAFSFDGRFLASGAEDGRVMLWEPMVSSEPQPLPMPDDAGPSYPITTLAFAPLGHELVMGRMNLRNEPNHRPILLASWEIDEDMPMTSHRGFEGAWTKVCFDPLDGTLLIASDIQHVQVQRCRMPGFHHQDFIRHSPMHRLTPILLAVGVGCVVLGQYGAPMVNLYRGFEMSRTLWCDRPYGPVHGLALHHDDRVILATPRALLIWTIEDLHATPIPVPVDATPLITSLAVSPDGMTLAIGREKGQVQLLDTDTWGVRDTFEWAVGRVRDLVFAPDGFRVAAAGDTGEVIIWDVE